MRFWVGVTDPGWFKFLSARQLEEVNFWQPSSKPLFSRALPGMPFLFKLKRPYNHIGGGGLYVADSILPLSVAWEVFGEKNGAATYEEFRSLLRPHFRKGHLDPTIGCTVLTNSFYLSESAMMEDPPGWAPNIVRGKFYDTVERDGRAIWDWVAQYLSARDLDKSTVREPDLNEREVKDKYGDPVLVRPRIGQSSFRVMVTDAYQRQCAMTGENTLEVLEAAHIRPYASEEGGHEVSNGLLLRADFHKLFDRGLVSVTPDYRIRVSPRIREAYFNGKAYYRLDKQPLSRLPQLPELMPNPDHLDWHFKNCFQR